MQVEHCSAWSLDRVVTQLRPHLVLLLAPPAGEGSADARLRERASQHSYELRMLQSLGEAAPPVRVCRGGVGEAAHCLLGAMRKLGDGAADDDDEAAAECDAQRAAGPLL